MRCISLLLGATALTAAAHATETITYSYDARGRLTQASHSGSVNNGVAISYTIDQADNRTAKAVTGVVEVPKLAIADAQANEGSSLSFTVTRSGSLSESVTVSFASANGTAVAPGDFTSASGSLSFAANETQKTISVTTIDDSAVEGNETLTVSLTSPSSPAILIDAEGTGTIVDNDTSSVAIADASVTEGGTLQFVLTRSGSTGGSASVNYATSSGTAVSPGDFTAASGTVNFAANETSKTINVSTVDDSSVESSETMTVTLSSPSSGLTISDDQATGTIVDNDVAPSVSFAISDAWITEGGILSFVVSKTGTTSSSFTVSYATSDGSAVAPSDYTAASGTLTFTANETSKYVSVQTINDFVLTGNLDMVITLSSPSSGATLSDSIGLGNIIDDEDGGDGGGDPCPTC